MKPAWEGLLLVDKPSGPTSHDIVQRIRRATGERRVGHAGTLDPPASGLLPLVLGRATRLVRFLPRSPKEYTGLFRLGLTTTTDDMTGEPLSHHDGPLPDPASVADTARRMAGRNRQVPPAVSARKVAGERLYRLARQGVVVQAPAAEIEVAEFRVRPGGTTGEYEFSVRVSAGTYIRALVRDLGARLGCGAVLCRLRRTAIGPLLPDPRLALHARTDPDPAALREALIDLSKMPLLPPAIRLEGSDQVGKFRHGVPVEATPSEPSADLVTVLGRDGSLLGIAAVDQGLLRPKVVLPPDPEGRAVSGRRAASSRKSES